MATGSSSWLVAWADTRNGGYDIFGKRFGFDGVEKTRKAQVIHEGPDRQYGVKLGWDGSRYLAAWRRLENPTTLHVARVEPNGTLLDPAGIQLGTGNSVMYEDVAGGTGDWLVTWSRSGLNGRRMLATVVRDDGTTTGLTTVSDNTGALAVARDPASGVYVLAWFMTTPAELRAIRVDSTGTLLDPVPVTLATGVSGSGLDMAAGGGVIQLAWNAGTGTSVIDGMRIRVAAGGIEALAPGVVPLVADGTNYNADLALGFTAKGFLMVFARRLTAFDDNDIAGLQLSTGGAVQGPPFIVSGNPESEQNPSIAGATQGRALVAYEYASASSGLPRIYVRRILAAYPDGATCSDGTQCESGFCADGRCCDSACGGGAGDCQACSVKAGAAVDGVCGVVEASTICRSSADAFCDLAERCDGVSIDCPLDRGRRAGEVCDADCGAVCPLADESGSPHVCPVCP
jgi:hypothetical protein